MLPHLVLLMEYSTEVSEVSQNFITLKSFRCKYMQKINLKHQTIWRDD